MIRYRATDFFEKTVFQTVLGAFVHVVDPDSRIHLKPLYRLKTLVLVGRKIQIRRSTSRRAHERHKQRGENKCSDCHRTTPIHFTITWGCQSSPSPPGLSLSKAT